MNLSSEETNIRSGQYDLGWEKPVQVGRVSQAYIIGTLVVEIFQISSRTKTSLQTDLPVDALSQGTRCEVPSLAFPPNSCSGVKNPAYSRENEIFFDFPRYHC